MLDKKPLLWRYIDTLIIIIFFLLSLLLRGFEISNVYMYPDETVYWRWTNLILANNWTLTEEILRENAPLLSYFSAILTILFEGRIDVVRMVSVVSGSLTVCFLYLLGKALYGRKVGMLSAFFLCFSSFHCIYSRIIMLEAFTLFFIVAFLYFFWKGYFEDKGMRYVFMAGIMLGLSLNAKYLSVFLIPAIFLLVLWVRRNWRSLIEKKIILILFIAFLVFLPLLTRFYVTGTNPFYFHAVERFTLNTGTMDVAIRQLPVEEIFVRATDNYLDLLTYQGQNLPWHHFFQLSVLLLIPITFFFHARPLINGEEKESFLIILMLSFSLFLFVGCARHEYYLLYAVPFYFIMLSNLAIKSIDRLKGMLHEKDFINVFRVFTILLVSIVILSYFITGVVSPWNGGDFEGFQTSVEYVKNDIIKEGNNERVIIGSLLLAPLLEDYINLNELNASSAWTLKFKERRKSKKLELDLDSIETFKPDYIIVNEFEYDDYFSMQVKKEIFKKYRMVLTTEKGPYHQYQYLVFKRNHEDMGNWIHSSDCHASGRISHDIFSASVPGVMTVGNAYEALVRIKNTGKASTSYTVGIETDGNYIFIDDAKYISIDRDCSSTLRFKLVPLKKCNKKLRITANLYAKECNKDEEGKGYQVCKLDSASDSVYLIKRRLFQG